MSCWRAPSRRMLRNEHGIPLQTLRRVGALLAERYTAPRSPLVFYLVGRDVFYRTAHTDAVLRADRTGQQVMPFEREWIEQDLRRDIARQRQRPGELVGRVVQRRSVAQNRPVLAGTRVPTHAVWA